MKRAIEKLRVEYGTTPLIEEVDDPFWLFEKWLDEAIKAEVFEPNGMVLSTVSALGHPSSRTVLLKGFGSKGFLFFTNDESRKGEQMKESPFVSLTFWWKEIYRQVCVEGTVKKATRKEAIAYFQKRPRGAQIAALISKQSAPLANHLVLEEKFNQAQTNYRGKKIPCPPSWSGFWVTPHRMEFWQGRKNRLHDRLLFVKLNQEWLASRLNP